MTTPPTAAPPNPLRPPAVPSRQETPDGRRNHLLLVVMADGLGPGLVEDAHRLARSRGGTWAVVGIDTPTTAERPRALRASLADSLAQAEALGARVGRLSLSTHTASGAIPAIVHRTRSEGADLLLIGRSRLDGPGWAAEGQRLSHFVDLLVDLLPGVTVQVIARPDVAAPAARPVRRPWSDWTRGWGAGALVLAACTAVAFVLEPFFHPANLVMVYLAGVVAVAARHGRSAAMAAVVGSVLLYDLLFVAPRWSLKPAEPHEWIAFGAMLVVGLLVGGLAARGREQATAAEARALRALALTEFARTLARARTEAAVLDALVAALRRSLAVDALAWRREDAGDDAALARARAVGVDPAWLARVLDDGREAGAGTPREPQAPWRCLPLQADGACLGAIAMRAPAPARDTLEDRQLAVAMCQQAAVALERARFERRSVDTAIDAERERVRSTLLAGISHDFRTPLTAIIGNATTLIDQGDALRADQRRALLASLAGEARRLHALTSNLLDLTRLEAGAVTPVPEWCPADELLQEAVQAMHAALGARRVVVHAPAELLVWCDPRLVGQALNNLLDNAARHTRTDGRIEVSAQPVAGAVELVVHDDGPGVPADQAEAVFRKFHRASAGPDAAGRGLGLAICAAVAGLQGGSIHVEPGPGARFVLRLPQPAQPAAAATGSADAQAD